MNSLAQRTRPLWVGEDEFDELRAAPLDRDLKTDVVVVGAGIAGMSVAYELACAGSAVVVLDAGRIGGGMTARTTAHLSNALDDRWQELIRLRGVEDARLAADSHSRAIDRIGEIVASEAIDCDFRRLDGYLFLASGDEPGILDRELDAAHRAGLTEVRKVAEAPLPKAGAPPAVCFPRQGRFHPLRYLAGLARGITGRGGRLFADTRASKFVGGRDAHVETADGRRVRAQAIVVATNTPVNDRVSIHTKQAPYRTYALAARIPKGSVADMLLWDTLDPYHYVRLQPQQEGAHDLLIVGGEDHKTGQANDGAERLERLEEWARARFPAIEDVDHRWSGQVMEPVDGLAFIGRNELDDDNVYIATGDSGMGMTHGAIAGMLVSDLTLGRENRWAKLYDPRRRTLAALPDLAAENINVAAQYGDLVTPGEIDSPEQLARGQGAVMRRGLRKIAAFRDDEGRLYQHSALCPHMGCVLRWNALEGSWDCPCHGSQFTGDGRVVNGPSPVDLKDLATAESGFVEDRRASARRRSRRPS